MKSYGKKMSILVPLDGSKNSMRGLDYGIKLAKITNRKIIGMHVMPTSLIASLWRTAEFKEQLQKNAEKIIKGAQKKTAKQSVGFDKKIADGIPGEEVVDFANSNQNQINMIIIGSKTQGTAKKAHFGSVANHILHKSKVPVLVV